MPPFWLSFFFSLLYLSFLSFCPPFFTASSSSFMASSSNKVSRKNPSDSAAPPPTPASTIGGGRFYSPNTTFIQTDPSNFKAIVHKFTGLRQETPTVPHKPPPPAAAAPPRPAGRSTSGEMRPRKPAFKLQERRQSARKLEIMLNRGGISGGGEKVMVSPVSPFQLLSQASGSPRSSTPTPRSTKSGPISPPLMADEEMRGILENGFYLHPAACSRTMRGSKPPQLLPLFPIHSRRDFPDDAAADGGDNSS